MAKIWTWEQVLGQRASQLVPEARDFARSAILIEESNDTFDACGTGVSDPFLIYTMPGGKRYQEFLYPGFALSLIEINELGDFIPGTVITISNSSAIIK